MARSRSTSGAERRVGRSAAGAAVGVAATALGDDRLLACAPVASLLEWASLEICLPTLWENLVVVEKVAPRRFRYLEL